MGFQLLGFYCTGLQGTTRSLSTPDATQTLDNGVMGRRQQRVFKLARVTWRFVGRYKWVISPIKWVISIVTLLITLLITTHEPPSMMLSKPGSARCVPSATMSHAAMNITMHFIQSPQKVG